MTCTIKATLFSLLVIGILSESAVAQETGLRFVQTPQKVKNLDTSFATFAVENPTGIISNSFRIRVWGSIDSTIDDDDLVSTSRLFSPLLPNNGARAVHELRFKFPLPPPDNREWPMLSGDTRSPVEWIGENVYFRGCIVDEVGLNELWCSAVLPSVVAPPEAQTPSASNGISRDEIELVMILPPEDNGQPLADTYRLEEDYFDSNGVSQAATFDFSASNTSTSIEDSRTVLRTSLLGRERGKWHDYTFGNQLCLTLPDNRTICSNRSSAAAQRSVGNTLADYTASVSQPLVINVVWEEFYPFVPPGGYYVTRCEAGRPDTCFEIAGGLSVTNYQDSSAERGKNYIYEIAACDQLMRGSCNRSTLYKMGVSNIGNVNLIDDYETDNNADQAKVVRGSINQLRSFHVADDEDWLRLDLVKPQSLIISTSGATFNNTELTLYKRVNQTLEQVAYNDNTEGEETLYSTIETEILPSGTYYIKVNQKLSGLAALDKPVANYILTVEITNTVIAPVLNLLLEE